jgi:hypothetical protein
MKKVCWMQRIDHPAILATVGWRVVRAVRCKLKAVILISLPMAQ